MSEKIIIVVMFRCNRCQGEMQPMTVVCLDMEGVLTPKNWIAFADKVD